METDKLEDSKRASKKSHKMPQKPFLERCGSGHGDTGYCSSMVFCETVSERKINEIRESIRLSYTAFLGI